MPTPGPLIPQDERPTDDVDDPTALADAPTEPQPVDEELPSPPTPASPRFPFVTPVARPWDPPLAALTLGQSPLISGLQPRKDSVLRARITLGESPLVHDDYSVFGLN